jgi:hypothetical protein
LCAEPKGTAQARRTKCHCLARHAPTPRVAKELLQRLRPDEPFILICLSSCFVVDGPAETLEAVHDAIVAARRQRSAYFEAHASYTLASAAAGRMQDAPSGTRLDAPWARPSAILECLRRAEEARRRCKGVLPTQWVAVLADAKAAVNALRPWLERCQRRGCNRSGRGRPAGA